MIKPYFVSARFAAPLLAGALALTSSMALAQVVDSKAAKKMLFGKASTAQMADVEWTDADAGAGVSKAIKGIASQIPYYGAIALSPGEPTSSMLMPTISNMHSVEAATKAALAECNARRTVGEACIIVATIVPKKYKPRSLTLSAEATQAFGKQYRKLKAPKAMAASPTTGIFGIDRGDGGRALSACNAKAGAKGSADCRIVIAD